MYIIQPMKTIVQYIQCIHKNITMWECGVVRRVAGRDRSQMVFVSRLLSSHWTITFNGEQSALTGLYLNDLGFPHYPPRQNRVRHWTEERRGRLSLGLVSRLLHSNWELFFFYFYVLKTSKKKWGWSKGEKWFDFQGEEVFFTGTALKPWNYDPQT